MPIPDGLAFATVTDLGRRLRCREFQCVELAQFFLDRVERLGPRWNAIVTTTRDRAMAEAARADQELSAGRDRGPLHGIPYGAKDLLATKGLPTSWGAAPFKDQLIDEDADVIARLRDAGAVLVAKLAMIEIAGGLGYRQANATFTGPGRNPWDPRRWAGGSSSGSGAAVAAGLVPFSIGTETWGSIMTPAGFCGVTGLRPTYDLVSRRGAMALTWTMDKIGPMARTAEDCRLVFQAISQRTTCSTFNTTFNTARRFRLGVLEDAVTNVQPEVQANFEASLKVCEQFATLRKIKLPDLPYSSVNSIVISCEMAAAFEDLARSGKVWEMTAEEDRWGLYSALTIPAKDYINAMRMRAIIQRELDAALAPFDAVLSPTLPTVAYPIDQPWNEYRKGMSASQIGGASNAAGIPAITVPNGVGESNLPTGLQFVGRAYSEDCLLTLAQLYQQRTNWHCRHPE
jgi:aspartyl-tRNA(Asn)/glutamyl-tRNA(Gln) amidotransferase subunit A